MSDRQSFSPGWTGLVPYEIESIYKVRGQRVTLPSRMALATHDTEYGIGRLEYVLANEHRCALVLSDGLRQFMDQYRAHQRYKRSLKTDKPEPYRAPPGTSMHEAGRAIDFSLRDALSKDFTLAQMWVVMKQIGWYPIIDEPNSRKSEAWHIEFRGPFQYVYEHEGYTTMARAAIADIRATLFANEKRNDCAHLQYQLYRLGYLTNTKLDGKVSGEMEKAALAALKNHVKHHMLLRNEHWVWADALACIKPQQYNFGGKGWVKPRG